MRLANGLSVPTTVRTCRTIAAAILVVSGGFACAAPTKAQEPAPPIPAPQADTQPPVVAPAAGSQDGVAQTAEPRPEDSNVPAFVPPVRGPGASAPAAMTSGTPGTAVGSAAQSTGGRGIGTIAPEDGTSALSAALRERSR